MIRCQHGKVIHECGLCPTDRAFWPMGQPALSCSRRFPCQGCRNNGVQAVTE